MSERILRATHGAADHPLKIGDVAIPCYVLEDGRRVIVQGSMITALDMAQGTASAGTTGDRLVKFASGKGVSTYIPDSVRSNLAKPIPFLTTSGALAKGYEATVLNDLCKAVVEARTKGKLNYQTEHIAERCQVLLEGFGRVGIIALVDEATGYQEFRPREALEQILSQFISNELLRWAKTFPDEFYRQLFRLKGWPYATNTVQRPRIVGTITNDLVYERLAPFVLEELKRITPKDDKGRRKHKYFQRLTEDIGNPKLREHLASVITLMRASPNWTVFKRLIDRALPRYDLSMTMDLELDDSEILQ